MRILSCHIENFGGLKGENISFNEGLNVILRENGWGKSTLAAFIKAMLYGLPATTKRSLYENDRRRLTPWNGGAFGGSMVFSYEGEVYRVERFFGSKESEDTFLLTNEKTKLESTAFTADLGVELTGLDAASFEKTVFLPQKSIDIEMTDGISAKLSDMLESGDDVNNYEAAISRLKDSRRQYAHLKGDGGKIYENEEKLRKINGEIEACEAAIDSLNQTENQIAEIEKGIEEYKNQLEKLEKLAREADEYALKKANGDRYISLKKSIEQSEQKTCNYKEINAQELDRTKEANGKISQINAEITALQNNAKDAQIGDITRYFRGDVPSETEVKEILAATGKITLLEKNAMAEKLISEQKQKKKKATARAFIISGVILAVGGIIGAMWNIMLIAIAAVAVILIVAGIIIGKNKEEGHGETQNELSLLCEKIDEFLYKYGKNGDRTAAIYEIKGKLDQLISLRQENEENTLKIKALENERANLDSEVRAFLNKYQKDLTLGFGVELDRLEKSKIQYETETEQQAKLKSELEEFLRTKNEEELKNLPQAPSEAAEDYKLAIKDAKDELDARNKSLMLLTRRKNELEATADSYNDLLTERDNLSLTIAEDKEKVSIIDKTAEFLENAKTGLSTRYLDKMAEGFGKYAREICEIDDYSINAKLDLSFKKEGKGRSIDYFSTGYRSLAGFCMRLSLADALYSGTKPFLVLDDPFVNLDDQKHQTVKRLLERLANDRQIIYFICRKDG